MQNFEETLRKRKKKRAGGRWGKTRLWSKQEKKKGAAGVIDEGSSGRTEGWMDREHMKEWLSERRNLWGAGLSAEKKIIKNSRKKRIFGGAELYTHANIHTHTHPLWLQHISDAFLSFSRQNLCWNAHTLFSRISHSLVFFKDCRATSCKHVHSHSTWKCCFHLICVPVNHLTDVEGFRRRIDCVVFSSLLHTHTHTHIHTYIQKHTPVPCTSTSRTSSPSLCGEVHYVHLVHTNKAVFVLLRHVFWLMCKPQRAYAFSFLFSTLCRHTKTPVFFAMFPVWSQC